MLNMKHGFGTLKWLEGYKFNGSWTNGKLSGSGILIINTYPKETILNGTFKTCNVTGKKIFSESKCCSDYLDPACFLLYQDGNLYRGECRDNQPHGYGWILYERWPMYNMYKYIGNWILGDKVGLGLQYYVDKIIYFPKIFIIFTTLNRLTK